MSLFQSLKGILVDFRFGECVLGGTQPIPFQSLKGILVDFRTAVFGRIRDGSSVSIPQRDFSGFQGKLRRLALNKYRISFNPSKGF